MRRFSRSSFEGTTSSSSSRLQCTEMMPVRMVLMCRWFERFSFYRIQHELDFPADEDLSQYTVVKPNQCTIELADVVNKYIRERRRRNKGWRFVCQLKDGQSQLLPTRKDDATFDAALVERLVPCTCGRTGSHTPGIVTPHPASNDGERRVVATTSGFGTLDLDMDNPPSYSKRS